MQFLSLTLSLDVQLERKETWDDFSTDSCSVINAVTVSAVVVLL